MKLILHIGMGKTGTSSIQRSLKINSDNLRQQKVAYLGMWFSFVDRKLAGISGMHQFFKETQADDSVLREKFLAVLKREKENGMNVCILSNEALLGQIDIAAPFLHWLKTQVDLKIIAYVREPYSWFPSAFTQWGIRHKTRSGPIQSFGPRARLIARHHYVPLSNWQASFDDCFEVFEYKKNIDIVQDFAEVTGISLQPMKGRVLERGEKAEVLLRALFNNRFEAEVRPDRFHDAMFQPDDGPIANVDEMIARCFDHSEINDVVNESSDLLNLIRKRHGVELEQGTTCHTISQDEVEAIRRRLLDYLIEISIRQGLAIEKLQKQLDSLEGGDTEKSKAPIV